MPLKCLQNGKEIYAFAITNDGDWRNLRETNLQQKHLTMPCCGSAVTLRTSKLGTRHFAHSRIGSCTTKPESAEHLLAKSIVAQSAIAQGWDATTEHSGRSDNGDAWIADVLLRKAGKRPVAVEVQWSRQHDEETRTRQHRYHSSGVRVLWLFRQLDFPIDQEVPAFRLIFDENSRAFSVGIPSHHMDHWVSRRERKEAQYWQQIIPLSDFISGALDGCLKFAPAKDASIPATIWTTEKFCYKCGCETKVVSYIRLNFDKTWPGHPNVDITIYDFDEWREGRAILRSLLPKDFLQSHNIGEVKPRFTGWSSTPQISNGCAHCGSLHGHTYDSDGTECEGPEIQLLVNRSLLRRMDEVQRAVERWWFRQA